MTGLYDALGVLAVLAIVVAGLWGPLTATYRTRPGRHRPDGGRVAFNPGGWDDRTQPLALHRSR